MLDVTKSEHIQLDAIRAMHGDAEALVKLRLELHMLHSDELKSLAPILQRNFGNSPNALIGGVHIDHDAQGAVSTITFVPPLEDRTKGSHSVATTTVLNNFVDDAEKLFDKLDTNKDGKVTITELGNATANQHLTPHESSLIGGLSALVEGSSHNPFPFGFTKSDLEDMRGAWHTVRGIAEASRDAQNNLSDNKNLFGPWGVTPAAIRQGLIGDCVLESSLASLAAHHPEKIRDMIKANKDGTYTVTFAPGKAFTVTAPTAAEQSVANRDSRNGIWPIIVEKAYSQYFQQQYPAYKNENILAIGDGLDSSETLSQVTNRPTDSMPDLKASGAKVAAFLVKHLSKNDPVIAGAKEFLDGDTPDGFSGAHEYSVLAFDPKGPNGGTVTVRNPWGSKPGTPEGQWQMSLWTFRANFEQIDAADMNGRPVISH